LFQKLIDVQQALIENPNPFERLNIPEKLKNPISVNFFFLKSEPKRNINSYENQAIKRLKNLNLKNHKARIKLLKKLLH